MTHYRRSITEPNREGLSWDELWKAADEGLIVSWERGRELVREKPAWAEAALAGEVLELPWRRDTHYYVAMWQGLRGEDLDFDFARGHVLTCAKTGKTWKVAPRGGETSEPHGRFELKTGEGGTFRFNLRAGNHEVVLTSQAYSTKAAAIVGIESVKRNASSAAAFERREASDGRPYFVVVAGNGQVVGQSQMYAAAASMEKGIDAVRRAAPGAEIEDVTVELG